MIRIGDEVRAGRVALGWSQAFVARRAGVSQASVSRLEAGSSTLTLAVVSAIVVAVGRDFAPKVFPGTGVNLRDSGQLAMAEGLRVLAHGAWRMTLEEPRGDGTGRAADVVLMNDADVVHIELEANLADFQAQLRNSKLKRDALAQRYERPVAFVLALRVTARNRAAVAAQRALLAEALPASSREVLEALRTGAPLHRDGLLWLRSRGLATPIQH